MSKPRTPTNTKVYNCRIYCQNPETKEWAWEKFVGRLYLYDNGWLEYRDRTSYGKASKTISWNPNMWKRAERTSDDFNIED